MSALWPNRCTGMMALVCGVIARDRGAGVDVERGRIDVDEDRLRAEPGDGAGGREERKGRRDHFVAGADVERHQRGQQRVGSRRHADGVRHAEERRQLALEPLDFGTADEVLAVADARDGLEHVAAEAARTVP